VEKGYHFNRDARWLAYCQTLEPLIAKITHKYMSSDSGHAEDAAQMARIAVATIHPEHLRATMRTPLSTSWETFLHNYCALIIRNTVLGYLNSVGGGDWYSGRTVTIKDPVTGLKRRTYRPPRFQSLDLLVERGMQIDSHFNTSDRDPHEGHYGDNDPSEDWHAT
jgi:hypothetical protein